MASPRIVALLTLLVAALPVGKNPHAEQPFERPPEPGGNSPHPRPRPGELIVAAEWFDLLFEGARREDSAPQAPNMTRRPERPGTFRTLCVRLCDGFAFPVSHSTVRLKFERDAARCEQSCPGRSRLFVHRKGEAADAIVDLNGRPYRALETAFLFRTQFIADCTCRGNPWDAEALARHRAYAESATKQSPQEVAGRHGPDKRPMSRRPWSDQPRSATTLIE